MCLPWPEVWGNVRRRGGSTSRIWDDLWLIGLQYLAHVLVCGVVWVAKRVLLVPLGHAVSVPAVLVVHVAVLAVNFWNFKQAGQRGYAEDIPCLWGMRRAVSSLNAGYIARWGRLLRFVPVDAVWRLVALLCEEIRISGGYTADIASTVVALVHGLTKSRMYLTPAALKWVLPGATAAVWDAVLSNPWQDVTDDVIRSAMAYGCHFWSPFYCAPDELPFVLGERLRPMLSDAGAAHAVARVFCFSERLMVDGRKCVACGQWVRLLQELQRWSPCRSTWVHAVTRDQTYRFRRRK